jgi:hypothetical protein
MVQKAQAGPSDLLPWFHVKDQKFQAHGMAKPSSPLIWNDLELEILIWTFLLEILNFEVGICLLVIWTFLLASEKGTLSEQEI